MKRGALVLLLAGALAVGAGLAALLRGSAESLPPLPTGARRAVSAPAHEPQPSVSGEAGGAAPAPRIDPDRRRLAQPDGPGAPGSLPERIDFPVAAKYAAEELSRVPHRVIGAWDARPDQAEPADLRVFVLLVEPATPDAELEDLLRDAAARHRDCSHLRVQVFDSETAARRPSWIDDGASRAEHLVAELIRHPDPAIAALRVRGRSLD